MAPNDKLSVAREGWMDTTSNYEKYQTPNPVMRLIIQRFLDRVGAHLTSWQPSSIVDLGCGEGLVVPQLDRLQPGVRYLGLEINPVAIEHARRSHPTRRFEQADLLEHAPDHEADVVLCLEVLEHMREPQRAVERIAQWTRDRALISVPFEPWFQLGNFFRGKYLAHLGNHPEHVQHFNPASLRALLIPSFDEVEVEICFPWLIGSCRKPAGKKEPSS